MSRPLTILVFLMTGALGQRLAAQAALLRIRLGGYVQDRDGKSWVGAQVHLVSRLMPGNEWIGKADHLVVESGKRGRFFAKVLPGRDYLIWAVSAPVNGVYRSTPPLIGVRSGPVRIRERSTKLVQVSIRVVGDDAWRRPLHLKVTGAPSSLVLGQQRVGDPYEVFPIQLDGQGLARIPLLPWKEVTVEVYDKRGAQLWVPTVPLALSDRKGDAPRDPGNDRPDKGLQVKQISVTESELRLPRPEERSVSVVDEKGAPIDGAELCQRVRGHLVLIAKSNKKGFVTTVLPRREENHWDRIFQLRGESRLVIRKEGFTELPAEIYGSQGVARVVSTLGTKTGPVLMLKRSPPHKGRLLLATDKPLAQTQLILYLRASGQVPHPVLLKTDSNGRYQFNQKTKGAWLLVALLDESTRRALSQRRGVSVSRSVILGATGAKVPDKDSVIDRSEIRLIQFSLERSDGGPSSFARIDGFRIPGFNAIPPLVQMRADRRGKLGMLVNNCKRMLIVAQDEQGFAARPLAGCTKKTDLLLGGMLHLSGSLKDKKGSPITGATVKVDPTMVSSWTHLINQATRNSGVGLIPVFHLGHRFSGSTTDKGRFSLWVREETDSLTLLLTRSRSKEKFSRTIPMNSTSRSRIELVID